MSFVMDDVRALQRNATQPEIQDSEAQGLTPNPESLRFPVHILESLNPKPYAFSSPKTPAGVKLNVSQIANVFLVCWNLQKNILDLGFRVG